MTLDSLGAQSESDFEVVVVCDGKDSETEALSKVYSPTYPLRWILTPENHGLASARNTGANAAKGEVLLFLDDDTDPTRELMFYHRRRHQAYGGKHTLIVVGLTIYVDVREPNSRTERFMRSDRASDDVRDVYCTVNPGLGSVELDHNHRGLNQNFSIKRQAFWDIGRYDPQCRYAEDSEFGARLYDGGAQYVFEPHAIAYHRETKDLSMVCRWKAEMTGRSDVYRVTKKRQRGPQTKPLTEVGRSGVWGRLKWHLYWERPGLVRAISQAARNITDVTGLRASYEFWRRFEMAAGYWQGVKSEGLTRDSLRRLVGEPVPVLAFPNISLPSSHAEKKDVLSPQGFLRVVQALRRLKYKSVAAADDLVGDAGSRSVVLTFNAHEEFYSLVFPHIDAFGLKPLVFLAAECFGRVGSSHAVTERRTRRALSAEQVLEMHAHGVQFGSCGLTQAWLPGLSDSDLCREVEESKARLENLLGYEVTCFAYPQGGVDARVRGAVARAGYKLAFSTRPGINFWEDRLCLRRISVAEYDTIADLALKLGDKQYWRQRLLE